MERSTAPAQDVPWLVAKREVDLGFESPLVHASTLAETDAGLALAFFGGPDRGRSGQALWFTHGTADAWGAPRCLVPSTGGRTNSWNPVLHQVPGGPLLLFFKQGENCAEWTGRMLRSADGGRTWGALETLPEGVWGPIRNKPLVLRDGSLLCPSSTELGRWQVHFERTADLGRTWTRSASVLDDGGFQAIQPALLPWPSGWIQALCRTRAGVTAETWSDDDGRSWTPLERTTLPNPNSAVDALRLRDGRALVLYNDAKAEKMGFGGDRTPLSVAISRDGRTWKRAGNLESGPGEFSYPCAIQTSDGLVHLSYTTGIGFRGIRHAVIDPAALPDAG